MDINRAKQILDENVKNKNLKRHGLAVSFAMGAIFDYLNTQNKLTPTENKDTWEMLGLLHDSDYEQTKDNPDKHTLVTLEWLEHEGIAKEDPLYLGIMTHNNKRTHLRNVSTIMEWALECVDELTGFLVACTLVLPSKKLNDLTLESVKKKVPQLSFAAGVDREQIKQCKEKLDIDFDTFIVITLKIMQQNSGVIGL